MKKTVLLISVLIALTFTAYSFMLQGSFKTMDDDSSIVRNEKIKDVSRAGDILTSSFFSSDAYYRPLVSLSFMAEYHFFGLNPVYYYLTNVAVHILTALVLFGVMNLLFGSRMLSFSIALLFAIHPVHWEAVSNISGRAVLLCASLYISAFSLFCRALKRKDKFGMYAFYGLSLASFSLALLSKESAGILPLLLSSYLFFMVKKPEERVREWALPAVPFFFLDGIYVLVRNLLGITHVFFWRSPGEAALGVMTFLRSVITYLRLFVMPVGLQFDRSRELFSTFLDIEALATVLFFVLLAALVVKFRKKLPPLALFFMSWFCIELLPVSQILVAIGVQPGYISTAEHFLYTPSVGIFVLLALVFQHFYKKGLPGGHVTPRALKAIIGVLYAFLFLMTIQANMYASNEIAMFERTLALNPGNMRIRNSLGLSYAKAGKFEEAEKHFRKALEVDPVNVRARISLGKSLCDQGKYREGIREYEKIKDAGDLSGLLAENLRLTYRHLEKISEK